MKEAVHVLSPFLILDNDSNYRHAVFLCIFHALDYTAIRMMASTLMQTRHGTQEVSASEDPPSLHELCHGPALRCSVDKELKAFRDGKARTQHGPDDAVIEDNDIGIISGLE